MKRKLEEAKLNKKEKKIDKEDRKKVEYEKKRDGKNKQAKIQGSVLETKKTNLKET